jgi:O-antigen ligase
MAHRRFIHSAGVRGRHSEARRVTTYAFPDAFAAISYAAIFAAGALIAMRRPAYAVVLLVVVQPFAMYGNAWVTTVTLPKAALLGVLLGLSTHPGVWRPLAAPAARALLIAGIIVLAATMLTFVHASFYGPVVRESLKNAEYILIFVAVVCAYRLDPDVAIVRSACIAVAALVAMLALSQEVYGATSMVAINGHHVPRVAGPLEGPNQLAGYLDVAIPLVFALCIDAPSLAGELTLFLLVVADVLTFSRGGLAGAFVAIVTVALTFREHIRRPIGFMIAGLAAGILAADVPAHSVTAIFRIWDNATTSGGVGTRTNLWRAALALWRQHPIFGIGAGNFELEVGRAIPGVRTHSNSIYLQSLVEGGIPSLAATLWLTYVSIATFVRDRLRSPFVAAACAASIALALHDVVDWLIFYPKVGGWWWIVLGLAAAQLAAPDRERKPVCA